MADLLHASALLLVVAPTLGALISSCQFPNLKYAVWSVRLVIFDDGYDEEREQIQIDAFFRNAQTATTASKLLIRQRPSVAIPSVILRLGIDQSWIEPNLLDLLKARIAVRQQEAESICGLLNAAAGFSPTFGVAAATCGLIQIMRNLSDVEKVGHGIAVAFSATIYGLFLANIIFLPAAAKIRSRMQLRIRLMQRVLKNCENGS